MNVPFIKPGHLPSVRMARQLVTRLMEAGWISQEAFHDDPPHRFVIRWSEKGRTQMTLLRQALKSHRPEMFDSSASPRGFWARLRLDLVYYRITSGIKQHGLHPSEIRLLRALAISCGEDNDGRVPLEFFSDLADD